MVASVSTLAMLLKDQLKQRRAAKSKDAQLKWRCTAKAETHIVSTPLLYWRRAAGRSRLVLCSISWEHAFFGPATGHSKAICHSRIMGTPSGNQSGAVSLGKAWQASRSGLTGTSWRRAQMLAGIAVPQPHAGQSGARNESLLMTFGRLLLGNGCVMLEGASNPCQE